MISPRVYNEASSLALLCPVTSKAKGFPFEVALPAGLPLAGVILALATYPAQQAWLAFLVLIALITGDNLLWRLASWVASYTFPSVTCDLRRDLFQDKPVERHVIVECL